MSSGTTAEPIQPEAPVTKMRMEILLGRGLRVMTMRGADAAAGRPMRSGRINSNTIMRRCRINCPSDAIRSPRVGCAGEQMGTERA